MNKINYLSLSFNITDNKNQFELTKNKKNVCSCSFINQELDISFLFTVKEEPLHLKSNAKVGDNVEIQIDGWSLSLFINKNLVDKEWYYGNHFLDDYTFNIKNTDLVIENKSKEIQASPSIIEEFMGGEGWMPGNGEFVGDCMPYTSDGRFHLMYLIDRHHHKSKWKLGAHRYAHISTIDFKHWQKHPMAIDFDNQNDASYCTGSYVKIGNLHYLYYTVRQNDSEVAPAPLKRSISTDGYHFEKDTTFEFYLSDKYLGQTARDPKIFKGEDGLWHILMTTALASNEHGCLVHLVSKDTNSWQELDEPFFITDGFHPECPDYFKHNDYYYFLYGEYGVGKYKYSKEPFGPWIIPDNPIIPCGRVPKCDFWGDKLIFCGFKDVDGYDYTGFWPYAGTLLLTSATFNNDGTLSFTEHYKGEE